jgi:RND superfamily putative drug exporter
MKLLGGWNWYLPAWLDWIPNVSVEGRRTALLPSPDPEPVAA